MTDSQKYKNAENDLWSVMRELMGMIVITQYKTDSVEYFTNNQKSHAYHKGLSIV